MEKTSKDLLKELLIILEDKKIYDSKFTNVRGNPSETIKQIQKTLSKLEPAKQTEILTELILLVQNKIKKEILNGDEILFSLPTIAKDLKKGIIKPRLIQNNEPLEKRINSTEELISWTYDLLKDYNRQELEKYEESCNHILKSKTSIYGQPKASGQIVGDLNRGMYGSTREELIKFIKENGIKISKDNRFINMMSTELLKYRVVGLYIASRYCEKIEARWMQNAKDSLSKVTLKDFEETREKTKKLGSIIKEKYQEENGITPREEILKNIYTGQEAMPEVYESIEKLLENDTKKHKK